MNLASNAVKYMRSDGDKHVLFVLERSKEEVRIVVEDTGIGIPATDLPRIFERFYRGNKMYGVRPGTGLGLAIVERIVLEHGGAVEVESAPGRGSRFTLRLPLRTKGS